MAQTTEIDWHLLESTSSIDRIEIIQNYQLATLDSTAFVMLYHPLLSLAEKKRDWQMEWELKFNYFLQRGTLKTTTEENIKLLEELLNLASQKRFKVGLLTASHYLQFEKYYANQLTHSALYTHILKEFEEMKELGLKQFSPYPLVWMLYHNGRFMYHLEDLDKALLFFQAAEHYIEPTGTDKDTYILVLNHLQNIYQQQGEFSKAIAYAEKILDFTKNPPSHLPADHSFYQQWEGLVSTDMAAMLVEIGNLEGSKVYAERGYTLAKTNGGNDLAGINLEYDALQVLFCTKLKINDLNGAALLLDRLQELYNMVGAQYDNFSNNIEYLQCRAHFHEMNGNYAKAVQYANLSRQLEDSLAIRTNARHLEQLKQRLEAEKFREKIQFLEQERQMEKKLRNAMLLILLLVLLLTYFLFNRQRLLRRQKEVELEMAHKILEDTTQRFREKSGIVESLRQEMDKLLQTGQRSDYLEQLTTSIILTEEDWLDFRNVFEKVHPGFIEAQRATHPGLTPAEMRYLTLKKLNLSTSEMANMLGVSNSAIRKTRARMKQKMSN
jgi:tetratricopeptide (TPR) repeat protein